MYDEVMGNREDLLAGAKRCLYEKGYAKTTARDIATASGVSLAAIGYHFGTKEALLSVALEQAIEEWGQELTALLTTDTDTSAGPAERFEATWNRVSDSFKTTRRLWAIQFELLAHLERTPELRTTFTESSTNARLGLAELFRDVTPAEDQTIGAFYQVMLAGLAAVWLADPGTAPTGRDLLSALRTIAAGLDKG
jgi:AcrR family transcriptional regulator